MKQSRANKGTRDILTDKVKVLEQGGNWKELSHLNTG